ncbi:hypothetical protein RCOM_0939080 [Ricinus communis]|uniref:TF-B3 domain-containing protein n=1 Tax=Ricinus communis TaxID=3988 RepID=B9RZG7_RICCO|nr:hypothetical protein RCOM_0939080 [Ricinus communis]
MRLTKERKNTWFDHGWHEFAKFYSLSHGQFLVFKHEGLSNFRVHILDMTACEITYSCIVRSGDEQEQPSNHFDETEDDDCFGFLSPTACPSRGKGASNKRKCHLSEKNLHRFCSGSDHPGINKLP